MPVVASRTPWSSSKGLDPHGAGGGTDLQTQIFFLLPPRLSSCTGGSGEGLLHCKPAPAHSHILLFLCARAGR